MQEHVCVVCSLVESDTESIEATEINHHRDALEGNGETTTRGRGVIQKKIEKD